VREEEPVERNIVGDEQHAFREMVRDFIGKEVALCAVGACRVVSRELWLAGGKAGLLGTDVPEEFGGGGTVDFRFNQVMCEEFARASTSGVGFPLHNDVVAPDLLRLATPEQRWGC
jgi:alkylation response protein AidB-like acyl-CoA dehydrogenase